MKTFREHLTEAKNPELKSGEVLSPKEMQERLGKTKFNALVKHPWFKEYFGHGLKPIAMKYVKGGGSGMGHDQVVVAMAPFGGLRKMVQFSLSSVGNKIIYASLFHNKDDEKGHDGKLAWTWIRDYGK